MAENRAPTFFSAADGKVVTPAGSSTDTGYGLAIQSNGKILLAGTTFNGSNDDAALARYNADGSLDQSFGTGGEVTTAVGASYNNARGVALQTDGKIVTVGSAYNGSNYDIAVMRYNADGSPDTSFSGDGKRTIAVGSVQDYSFGVAIDADGKIVIAGSSSDNTSYDFAVVRLDADGSLDSTFDGDGTVVTEMSSSAPNTNNEAIGVAIDAGGRILAAGYSKVGDDYDFAIARYTATGQLDSTFDGDGKKTWHFLGSGFNDYGASVLVQPNNKIVVAGHTDSGGSTTSFAIARMNEDGSRDYTFGSADSTKPGGRSGQIITPVTSGNNNANSVAMQSDGKIVVAGYSYNGTDDFALVRYTADGRLDTSFGQGGKVTVPIGPGNDSGYSVKIQPDGKIVVGGSAYNGSNSDFALVRFNANGSLDTTFGATRFTEGGAAVVIDENASVSDANLNAGGTYSGALLALSRAGGARAEDVFAMSSPFSSVTESGGLVVDGTYIGTVLQNSGGTLSIAFGSAATQQNVNAALRQITYKNASDAPPGAVTLAWTFSDGNTGAQGTGGAKTASGTTAVHITPVNDAPKLAHAVADQSVAEDTGWSFALPAATFTDPDSSLSFSAKLANGAALSSVGLSFNAATGNFSGKTPLNFNGALDILVTASDGKLSASDTFRLNVTPVNDAPALTGAQVSLAAGVENKSYVVSAAALLSGFTDADGDRLAIVNLKADHGTVQANGNGTFTISPQKDYHGTMALTYGVSDGTATVAANRSITFVDDAAPHITSGKGAPKASVSIAENGKAVATVKAADADGDKLSWSIAGGKDAKLFAIDAASGALSFKSAPDFETPKDAGRDNTYDVKVEVSDGTLSDTQALSVHVSNVKGVTKTGTSKTNTLSGTSEEDGLKGLGGADKLYGKGGNDHLTGGSGADKLYGGDGKKGMGHDTFVFTKLSDSTVGKSGQDTIYDFASHDRIDLSDIDASTKARHGQAFSFIGSDKFDGHAGELRYDKGKSDTFIYADTNGDKHADFAIHLDDALTMTKGNFIL